jgi:hypothetical protein
MDNAEVLKRIKETKSIKDKEERLEELRCIAEDLANDFTYGMSYLEDEISFVLERTSQKIKDELGYHDVGDVTNDINVTNSYDWKH